jgi:hypothetical protein
VARVAGLRRVTRALAASALAGVLSAGRRFYGIGHSANRFIWTVTSRDACRWEQAFSVDGGRTWETNWIMDFTRLGEAGM